MIRFQTLGTLDLRRPDDAEIREVLAQPKRLALFAYLVLARPRGFHRRDTLAGLFWPERDTQRARSALSRALYYLRSALGAEVIVNRGDQEVGVDFTRIECDALSLEELASACEWRQADELYQGDLLNGFFVSDAAAEFEHWLDGRRSELRMLAGDVAWRQTERAEQEDRIFDVLRHARRTLALHPGNEAWLRRVMELLNRIGDKAAAAGAYREFAQRLADEFELEPSPETQRLLAEIRSARAAELQPLPPQADPSPTVSMIPADPTPGPERDRARRKLRLVHVAAAAIVALAILGTGALRATRTEPLLAVGRIDVSAAADSLSGFETLLITNLARLQDVAVVSERRLAELGVSHDGDVAQAARDAGATDLIEGTLAITPRNELRLDLRRVDLRTGQLHAAMTVHARDIYQAVDIVVDRIASDLRVPAPADRMKGHTHSLLAYRLYEEGLRAWYGADRKGAERLFRAALQEDTTFAMAALYLSRITERFHYSAQAARFAQNSSEGERLLIQAEYAYAHNDPSVLARAESLAVRHPHDLDGALMFGTALVQAGRFSDAIPHLQRVIRADTAIIDQAARCRACDAVEALANAYYGLDSMSAAQKLVLMRRRLQPTSYGAWLQHFDQLMKRGRYNQAEAALDSAAAFTTDRLAHMDHYTSVWIRRGEFAPVDALWSDLLRTGDAEARESALWGQTISLRAQGRLREALTAARQFRKTRDTRLWAAKREPGFTPVREALLEALVLLEMGRFEESGALFLAIANEDPRPLTPLRARDRAWHFTHAATAFAAVGDTARLRVLEDSVRVNSERTASGSIRRLPHYVRGLRLAAQNRHAEAAAAFQNAVYLPYNTMARIHYERAKALLAAGDARAAVVALRYALAGPISAAGLYVTQTDIQELLGLAWERAAQPDSAVVQYRRALNALKHADPALHARRRSIEQRVANLTRSASLQP